MTLTERAALLRQTADCMERCADGIPHGTQVECCVPDGDVWHETDIPAWIAGVNYRLAPIPKPVRRALTVDDVPPNSVFRPSPNWVGFYQPNAVRLIGVDMCDRANGLPRLATYDELMKSTWQIKRSNADWQPCWIEE